MPLFFRLPIWSWLWLVWKDCRFLITLSILRSIFKCNPSAMALWWKHHWYDQVPPKEEHYTRWNKLLSRTRNIMQKGIELHRRQRWGLQLKSPEVQLTERKYWYYYSRLNKMAVAFCYFNSCKESHYILVLYCPRESSVSPLDLNNRYHQCPSFTLSPLHNLGPGDFLGLLTSVVCQLIELFLSIRWILLNWIEDMNKCWSNHGKNNKYKLPK